MTNSFVVLRFEMHVSVLQRRVRKQTPRVDVICSACMIAALVPVSQHGATCFEQHNIGLSINQGKS